MWSEVFFCALVLNICLLSSPPRRNMEYSLCSSSTPQTLALKAMTLIALLLTQIHCSMHIEEQRSHLLSLSDKILKLPGQPQVGFQQFSGYVPVGAGNQRALFYYLVEAEIDPSTKPLVLWLNGGNHAIQPHPSSFSLYPFGSFIKLNSILYTLYSCVLLLTTQKGLGVLPSESEPSRRTVRSDQVERFL